MCPVCLASSLYVIGGVSDGTVTTFLAVKLLRPRPEPKETIMPTDDRIER
jgi:hypothetical protein